MKFPRSARMLRNPSDAAPYAAVLFLLLAFLLLAALLPIPGVKLSLNLPAAADLPGTAQPSVAVAIDAGNRLYYDNRLTTPAELKSSLNHAASLAASPPTLVIQADQSVSYGEVLQLTLLARDAGITNALLATMPREDTPPSAP